MLFSKYRIGKFRESQYCTGRPGSKGGRRDVIWKSAPAIIFSNRIRCVLSLGRLQVRQFRPEGHLIFTARPLESSAPVPCNDNLVMEYWDDRSSSRHRAECRTKLRIEYLMPVATYEGPTGYLADYSDWLPRGSHTVRLLADWIKWMELPIGYNLGLLSSRLNMKRKDWAWYRILPYACIYA
jgi:hypothetical protein